MHDTPDRIPLCRCFGEWPAAPSIRHAADAADAAAAADGFGEDAPRLLRPGVHRLQRWIDLNA